MSVSTAGIPLLSCGSVVCVWACLCCHLSVFLSLCIADIRNWLSKRILKKLLQSKRKQDKAIQEFLSLASSRGSSSYNRLQELSKLDAVRFEENKRRQAVVVGSFLSAVTEQGGRCCARLQELTRLDAWRFAEQEKQREAVATFLSAVSDRARTYCESVEKLNRVDSARFIELKQAEAVKAFQSLNSFFLTEQQEELHVRDSEDKMSVMGLGKARGRNENKRVLNSHPKGQQGWKEEMMESPDYENLEATPLNNGMEDYDDVQNLSSTSVRPEGYVLLTSPPAVESPQDEEEEEEEEEEGDPIYENLSKKPSSTAPRLPKQQLIRIHSQPSLGGENEIMVSAPPATRRISEEQLRDGDDADYVNDDIYVDTGLGYDLGDEVEEIYEDTSVMNQVDPCEELYDDLQSVMGRPEYDRADNFPGAVPKPQARFTSSAHYSEHNPPVAGGTLDGKVFGISQQEPSSVPNGGQYLEDSGLYVDVSSAMSEMPVKNHHVSPPDQGKEPRKKLSSVLMEPLPEESETYVDLRKSCNSHLPDEGENSIYENADDIRLQMASELDESIEVGLPFVIKQQGGSGQSRQSQRISITVHATGNSPYDSEDYDDTEPANPPQQRTPSSPKVPKRAPTTRLTTVPDPTLRSQENSKNKPHRGSASSNGSGDPSPYSTHHSRYPSSDGDVFLPENAPTPPSKTSAFLSPRMSKRRSALKTKSTSSISSGHNIKSGRKTSAPHMPLSKQTSELLRPHASSIQNKPLPPIPSAATSSTQLGATGEDDIYDYADTGPTVLYEDPGEMKKTASPYTPPVKKGGRLPLGKTKSVADAVFVSDGMLSGHTPVTSAATISNRPPALLPSTLSRDRPPAPLPAVALCQPMGASRGLREPSSHGTPPPKAGGATPPPRRSSAPPQVGSATPPLPARNVVRTYVPKANTPLPPLPPEASNPPPPSPRMATPLSPPNRGTPPPPFMTTPLSPLSRAPPPPPHMATPSPPPATPPVQNAPRNTKPPARDTQPPLPAMGNTPPPPPAMRGAPLPPPATGGTPLPPPAMGGAPPPPPAMGGAPPPPPAMGGAPPPPPPPPPVGGLGVKKQPPHSSTNQNPQPKPPPSTRRGSSDLLSSIGSVQLKKASDRPSPEPAPPTSGGGAQGNLMSEMQSFRLKKRVTKTKSDAMNSREQTDSGAVPPGAFHFKLKPTSSVPFAGSQPPPVKTRPQGKPSPAVHPAPGHEEVAEVPEWKQKLQQRKQKKTSVPKVL